MSRRSLVAILACALSGCGHAAQFGRALGTIDRGVSALGAATEAVCEAEPIDECELAKRVLAEAAQASEAAKALAPKVD
jgi:hypothetical protein